MKQFLIGLFLTIAIITPLDMQAIQIDYGSWGTITVYIDETATLSERFSSISSFYMSKVRGWEWSTSSSRSESVGFYSEITSQSNGTCVVKGRWNSNGYSDKIYCKMTYGSSNNINEYIAYYNVIVKSRGTITVSASPSGGTVAKGTKVTITPSVSGSTIYYTTDGSMPTTSSSVYSSSSGVIIDKTTTLKARAVKSGYESEISTWNYTVKQLVENITISPSIVSLGINETKQLTATVTPSNAADKSVTWSSSPTGIVTVSSTGLVKAVKEGTTTVTCKANDGSGKYATCKVTVTKPEVVVAEINATNFPDAAFRNWLLERNYGTDGKLTEEEISSITSMDVSGTSDSPGNISSLKGIEFFTALKSLYCDYNKLTSLDVSKNTALTLLSCYKNGIKGKAMDNLISSLPQNNSSETHRFGVVDQDISNEGNICTTAQVAAVKAKGWFPCYYNRTTYEYVEYEGSDDTSVTKGDVNGDNDVSGTDLVALSNIVLGRKEKTAAADVNGDGSVSGTDIVALSNIILGRANARRKAPSTSAYLSIDEPFDIKAGETKEMLIDLTNPQNEITLAQFDLHLPIGLSIKKNGSDLEFDMAERTTWRKHTLDASEVDGAYRFLLYSSGNTLIEGTSGAIIKVTVVADNSFSYGKIVIDNALLVSPDEKETKPEAYEYTVGTSPNGVIEYLDLTLFGSDKIIYGNPVVTKGTAVRLEAADEEAVYIPNCTYYYTLDGSTPTRNSSHFTAVSYDDTNNKIIINKSCTLKAFATCEGYSDSEVRTWQITVENEDVTPDDDSAKLSVEPFDIKAGETKEILIDLTNPQDEVTLVQFDLHLPTGLSIKKNGSDLDFDMAERTTWRKHTLDASEVDGAYRFLLYSSGNTLIEGTSGAIIKVPVVADNSFSSGKIIIDNALLVSPDEKETKPATYEYTIGEGTGISTILMGDAEKAPIYSLSGQRLQASRKGVNIIGGKKVVVK